MTHGFLEKTVTLESGNGRDDKLLSPLHFKDRLGHLYRVPVGSTTDGMSTPPLAHTIPGFQPTGNHWLAAVLHDSAYRGTLERMHITHYQRANLSRERADALFREALGTLGVHLVRRNIIHIALRLFGWTAYRRAA